MPVELRSRRRLVDPAEAEHKKKAAAPKRGSKAKDASVAEPKPVDATKAEEPAAAAVEEKADDAKTAEEETKSGVEERETDQAGKKAGPIKEGDAIELDGFGGEVQTHDGHTTTLKALVEASKSGVAIFTYPKASTPGCECTLMSLLFIR